MIGYVTLGTNNLERAAAFYDALLTEFGAKRIMETERFIVWGGSTPNAAALSIIKPFGGDPATPGKTASWWRYTPEARRESRLSTTKPCCLEQPTRARVVLAAMAAYGAYFRDLDGNKLNAFFIQK